MLSTLLGFGLERLGNLFALGYRFWMRPRLRIQLVGDAHVLRDHEAQVGPAEFRDQIIYGFKIRNCGRKVARGVRAYLVKTELRYKDDAEFRQASEHAFKLPWYEAQSDDHAAVLVPDASVTVELAFWQEGLSVVVPTSWEEYCEVCGEAVQFRFTVAVVEDGGWHPPPQEFVIDNPWPEESLPIEFWAEVAAEAAPPGHAAALTERCQKTRHGWALWRSRVSS